MKKSVKKLVWSFLITTATLIAGFAITFISFRLFDQLTANQMKILFAADILVLAAAATGVWYFYESKKAKKRRRKAFEKRHNERVAERKREIEEINKIISRTNIAA